MVFLHLAVFAVALLALVKFSDVVVENAALMARKLGVGQIAIGLTIVAIGTSIPELSASIAAAIKSRPGIIVGNIVGSNAANIGLVVAISTLFSSVVISRRTLKRDGEIMLLASALFFALALNSAISKLDSLVLLAFFVAYSMFLFETSGTRKREYAYADFVDYFLKFRYVDSLRKNVGRAMRRNAGKRKVWKELVVVAVSSIGIVVSADYLVNELVWLASWFGVSTEFVSLTLLAIGTSLPELSVSLRAAKKGFEKIALGNVIGSNIANLTLIPGIVGLINPLYLERKFTVVSIPAMLALSALFLLLGRKGQKISKPEGIALFAAYIAFVFLSI